uniref:UPAR/Ly6 domain-containing protein n=1 Tax=Xenopus tropicalis TaxID=8364 RepID=A0A6I8SXG5_XENTR
MGGTEPLRQFYRYNIVGIFSYVAAAPLQCYTCPVVISNANCLTPTNCSESDTSCMTSMETVGQNGDSTKRYCTPSDRKIDGSKNTVSCCNTDLCNVSAAPGVKYSYPALGLSLGFLLVLLRGSAL